ncbi:hypothetical protein [Anditalea andensis]|uniref:Lipoprotein n=1 Tax=Anditalea andensis TaxID=1048983 RepID=A0A074KW36_9BACT|nr:hypothetical protein [Anditalea andensis]KEO73119.1 hypothetical protein EL17_16040 [Anditalea andensis]
MKRISVFILFIGIIWASCSDDKQEDHGLHFELVDSLMVDMLEPLYLDDYSSEQRMFLLKGNKSRQPLLVDIEGRVIREFDVVNEGPDGVGSNGAFGYKFLGKDRFVAQGFYTSYFIYDLKGKQIKAVPFNSEGLYRMMLYKTRTTFHPFIKEGQAMMVGEEPNSYNPAEISFKKSGADFYNHARVIYGYNLDTEENRLLESFPPEWEPRANNRFVGESFPLMDFNKQKMEMAVLPRVGTQLFLYDYAGSDPVYKGMVELTHRHRPNEAPAVSPEEEGRISDYPNFSDIRYAGDYILIQFFTQIPADINREIQAQAGDQYYSSPEFKEAQKRYIKPYYIVVKEGKQIGTIDQVPVHGTLNFVDDEGNIYFNDNISPEIERDYNLFYKLRIKG